jgi:nucleoside-diphosphate-sugar epimerase
VGAPVSGAQVLVPGASSQVGVFAVPLLVAAGFEVIALSRHPRPRPFPHWPQVRWLRSDELLAAGGFAAAALQPVAMLSAGPLDVARHYLEHYPGIRRVAVTSTTSVLSKASSPDPAERRQMAAIEQHEGQLRVLARQRELALTILRPTLVYGCGLDRNISLLAGIIERFGVCPVSTAADGLRQPLHAQDLAAALVRSLAVVSEQGLESPLVGGSTLSYRAMVELVFQGYGRTPRLLRVPPSLLSAALAARARVAGSNLSPAMVARQAQDLVFDDQQARKVLGIKPRRYAPARADFSWPEAAAWQRLAKAP